MKKFGMIRRVDGVGRIAIPKEIKNLLEIEEGTPLEIYFNEFGEIVMKKYEPEGEELIEMILDQVEEFLLNQGSTEEINELLNLIQKAKNENN